jgi:hypothetical protein
MTTTIRSLATGSNRADFASPTEAWELSIEPYQGLERRTQKLGAYTALGDIRESAALKSDEPKNLAHTPPSATYGRAQP